MTSSDAQAHGTDGTIAVRHRGSMVVLELARERHANAYTQAMLGMLEQEIERADADPGVRVIAITGEGRRAFSAGADRGELATRDWRSVVSLPAARVFTRLRRSRCVTIAAINGAAVGGGMELALSCDLRLAVTSAIFRLPEPEFGLLPAAGGTALLPALVGPLRTKELILGGAEWDAAAALQAGFLTEVTSTDALWARVDSWVERIERRDAGAIALAKQAIDAGTAAGTPAGFELLAQSLLVKGTRGEKD